MGLNLSDHWLVDYSGRLLHLLRLLRRGFRQESVRRMAFLPFVLSVLIIQHQTCVKFVAMRRIIMVNDDPTNIIVGFCNNRIKIASASSSFFRLRGSQILLIWFVWFLSFFEPNKLEPISKSIYENISPVQRAPRHEQIADSLGK
jgi:hypothetical protein